MLASRYAFEHACNTLFEVENVEISSVCYWRNRITLGAAASILNSLIEMTKWKAFIFKQVSPRVAQKNRTLEQSDLSITNSFKNNR